MKQDVRKALSSASGNDAIGIVVAKQVREKWKTEYVTLRGKGSTAFLHDCGIAEGYARYLNDLATKVQPAVRSVIIQNLEEGSITELRLLAELNFESLVVEKTKKRKRSPKRPTKKAATGKGKEKDEDEDEDEQSGDDSEGEDEEDMVDSRANPNSRWNRKVSSTLHDGDRREEQAKPRRKKSPAKKTPKKPRIESKEKEAPSKRE